MATVRGRDLASMGGLFTAVNLSGTTAGEVPGQPVMIRMQGVPTMPGYRDRPGKWNMVDPRRVREWVQRVIRRWRPASSEV